MEKQQIFTKRLVLRPWCEKDLEPFAKMNADPRVREFFPSLLKKPESDLSVKGFDDHFEKNGWGFWAISIPNVVDFAGFVGLQHVNFQASFTPAVEIGWRLAHEFWQKGYATEGAEAALKFGFEDLNLEEIVAFTSTGNQRSMRVMEKIGMEHDKDGDFIHPRAPVDSPMKHQVLYRIKNIRLEKK